MSFGRAVLLLVRTDIVLERRAPQLALAMALFAAVAQVVLHYGTDIPEPPVAVAFWPDWPGAVQGAPGLGAAQRTLDGEDQSGIGELATGGFGGKNTFPAGGFRA